MFEITLPGLMRLSLRNCSKGRMVVSEICAAFRAYEEANQGSSPSMIQQPDTHRTNSSRRVKKNALLRNLAEVTTVKLEKVIRLSVGFVSQKMVRLKS
jgi:hypothetical protein